MYDVLSSQYYLLPFWLPIDYNSNCIIYYTCIDVLTSNLCPSRDRFVPNVPNVQIKWFRIYVNIIFSVSRIRELYIVNRSNNIDYRRKKDSKD